MKKDIHPKYHETNVTCACGNSFDSGSTLKELKTEICSACHPFYTGKQKIVDSANRIKKFEAKVAIKTKVAADRKGKKVKRATRAKTKADKIDKE